MKIKTAKNILRGYRMTPETLIRDIERLDTSKHKYMIFEDWLRVSANATAKPWQAGDLKAQCEAEYHSTVIRYDVDARTAMAVLYAKLTGEFHDADSYTDFLGEAFMAANLGNKNAGQFFTPMALSNLSADIAMAGLVDCNDDGPIVTMHEPASGAGGMVLACANTLTIREFPYASRLLVDTIDIDERCFHMTYLQLSLAGVAAIVNWGNALSDKLHKTWVTPAYVLNRLGPRYAAQLAEEEN